MRTTQRSLYLRRPRIRTKSATNIFGPIPSDNFLRPTFTTIGSCRRPASRLWPEVRRRGRFTMSDSPCPISVRAALSGRFKKVTSTPPPTKPLTSGERKGHNAVTPQVLLSHPNWRHMLYSPQLFFFKQFIFICTCPRVCGYRG